MRFGREDYVFAATGAAAAVSLAAAAAMRALDVRRGAPDPPAGSIPMEEGRAFFLYVLSHLAIIPPFAFFLKRARPGALDHESGAPFFVLEGSGAGPASDRYTRVLRATSWYLPAALLFDALRSVLLAVDLHVAALFFASIPEATCALLAARRLAVHRRYGRWSPAAADLALSYLGPPDGPGADPGAVKYAAREDEVALVHMPVAFFAATSATCAWLHVVSFASHPAGDCPVIGGAVAVACVAAAAVVVFVAWSRAADPSASHVEVAAAYAVLLALVAADARLVASSACDVTGGWASWLVRASEAILVGGIAYARARSDAAEVPTVVSVADG